MEKSPTRTPPVRDDVLSGWVATRRDALAAAVQGRKDIPVPGQRDPWWGLALSGGGIRSATFALGVLSGLASRGLLRRFDLLSTVSGGGYVGGALGKLYGARPGSSDGAEGDQARAASTEPVTATTQSGDGAGSPRGVDPLHVESRLGYADSTWFVWWLRATSRYLTPRGASDLLVAATAYARNMLAVHVELALAGMAVGALLALYNLLVWRLVYETFGQDPSLVPLVGGLLQPWLSTVWLLLPVPLLASVPLISAYWAIPARRGKRWVITQVAFSILLAAFGLTAGLIASRRALWGPEHDGALGVFCAALSILLVLVALGPLVARAARIGSHRIEPPATARATAAAAPSGSESERLPQRLKRLGQAAKNVLGTSVDTGASAEQRTRLTKWVAWCVTGTFAVFVVGLVDRGAWFVAFERSQYTYVLPLVIAMGIAIAHTFASQASASDAATAVSERFVFRVADLSGLLLFALLAVFWVAVVYRVAMINLFAPPPTGELLFDAARRIVLPFLALPALYMLLTCKKAEFCNLSSLHMFYRARLTRSYLGASNPSRFVVRNGSTFSEDDPLQDAKPAALVQSSERRSVFEVDPHDTVCLDDYTPHSAGGPVHILNVTVNQTRDPLGGLFNQDRKGQYLSITSQGRYRVGVEPWKTDSSFGESQLPAWMAISGAAVAPGLGGQTSTGVALLLFMAGVRLGFWWEMDQPPASRLRRALGAISPNKYRLMYGEAFAKFGGTGDRFWYLSDGGHFENTGAYALLREHAELVVLVDAAADPHYTFEDVENLVRKARIDLQAEITFVDPAKAPDKLPRFGTLDQLRDATSDACLALARIDYADQSHGWLVVVKPNMFRALPIDVINYRRDHSTFPQEPTADQFFSEAQWESYFRLGRALGLQLERDLLEELARDEAWACDLAKKSAAAAPAADLPAAAAKEDLSFSARFPRAGSLAKSGLSLTALAAVLTTTGQAWQKYSNTRDTRGSTYWSEIYTASALRDHVVRDGDKKLEPELTAKMANIANTYCHDGKNEIPHDTQAAGIYSDVSELCEDRIHRNSTERPSPACSTLTNAKVRTCLAGGERLGQPVYWAVPYPDAEWAKARVLAAHDRSTTEVPSLADDFRQLRDEFASLGHKLVGNTFFARSATTTVSVASVRRAPASAAPTVEPGLPAPAPAASADSEAGSDKTSEANMAEAKAKLAEALAEATKARAMIIRGPNEASTAEAKAAGDSKPMSHAAPGAAGAAKPPPTTACGTRRVYVQIYSDDQASAVQGLVKQLEAQGARVPRVENLAATALREGRPAPRPVAKPTAVYHTDGDLACADWIQEHYPGLVTRHLARGLQGTPGVVEVWVPPPPAP